LSCKLEEDSYEEVTICIDVWDGVWADGIDYKGL